MFRIIIIKCFKLKKYIRKFSLRYTNREISEYIILLFGIIICWKFILNEFN